MPGFGPQRVAGAAPDLPSGRTGALNRLTVPIRSAENPAGFSRRCSRTWLPGERWDIPATLREPVENMRARDQSISSSRNEEARRRLLDDLAASAAATLPGAAPAFAYALRTAVNDPACYEASVRRGATGVRAGRMMIEQSPGDLVPAIAAALAIELPKAAAQWMEAAAVEGLPVIAGWDLRHGGGERAVKLYVNASDASQRTRARLCTAVLPDLRVSEAPAVLGMNVRADGAVETKIYLQSSDAVALAERLGESARRLAAAARAEQADAGGVLSLDVATGGRTSPRGFFIALREPSRDLWPCVRALPGFDADEIGAALPFAPAPPRSVGIALEREEWTLYCKPRDSGGAPQSLEPTGVFRDGDLEVGVFVEPNAGAARAFRRTERSAVSIRVRHGAPAPHHIESLVDWFTERLRAAEAACAPPRLADPPPPWHAVDADRGSS